MTGRIRQEIAASPFTGEGHRKFWARLRVAGVRTSKARVLRLMREAQLLAPQRQAAPVARKAHTGTITTDRPNQMWGIAATATVTLDDGAVTVFAAIDHCTADCVGIHAAKRATRFEALDPIRQGLKEYFAGFHADAAAGLRLRHDHGSLLLDRGGSFLRCQSELRLDNVLQLSQRLDYGGFTLSRKSGAVQALQGALMSVIDDHQTKAYALA